MTEAAAERYVRLGLQLGRHVDGVVDAYYGPPELAAAVDAEPRVELRTIVSAAEALLDELEDGWLRDQVVGLRTYAGVLAGESVSYADEVDGCYGVRPTHTDEALFAAAHEQLEELLPGEGPLAERYARWQDSIRVPAEQVEPTVAAVIKEAREHRWPGRATGRRRRHPGDRARRALARILRVPRRPAQPDLRQRRPPAVGDRAARAHDARDVSRPPRGALSEGARARTRQEAARGDLGAGADTAVSRLRGDRRARAVRAARGRRRDGARRGAARGRDRARPPPRARRSTGARAVQVGGGQRSADAARRRRQRG